MNIRTKKAHERAAKMSISLPPKLYEFAADRVRAKGYASLSSYLQSLVRQDAELLTTG